MYKKLILSIAVILVLTTFSSPVKGSGQASDPSPSDGGLGVNPTALLGWSPGGFAASHDVYFGTDYSEVNDANSTNHPNVDYNNVSVSSHDPGTLELGKTYYWRVDEVNEAHGSSPCTGDVWSFTVDDGKASNPSPSDGDKYVPCDSNISWTPGILASLHDVYFGTDWNDVNEGDLSVFVSSNQEANNWDPGAYLEFGRTYYWRVDEVNDGTTVKGDVWSFTTGHYLVVDDMESYDDSSNRIYDTWKDFRWNWTGSLVDLGVATNSPVYKGEQSMKYFYFNEMEGWPGMGYYSEIEADTSDLRIGSDWTALPTKLLSLWFFGDYDNDANDTERMYVALEDGGFNYAEVRYGDWGEDTNDIRRNRWQQWNIALQNFADGGVDLSDVNKVYIGFGERGSPLPGGLGLVCFDHIRLYTTCGSASEPGPPEGATNVAVDVTLSWFAGPRATSHNVYLGTNDANVNDATVDSPEFKANQTSNSYSPGTLAANTTYYWRIDAVCHGQVIDKGQVWGFTTFGGDISRAQAYQNILEIIEDPNAVRIHPCKYAIGPNTIIETFETSIESPPFESWHFFIDDHPLANWEHPCRYVFVDTNTGQYQTFNANSAPINFADYAMPAEGSLEEEFGPPWEPPATSGCQSSDRNYAVIISGGIRKDKNYQRYSKDCSFIYKTLVKVYGYHHDHIYVLMSDGLSDDRDRKLVDDSYDSSPHDLDDDGVADVKYSATKEDITKVFDELKEKLDVHDFLFIFTTNHGGKDQSGASAKDAKLCLWNGTSIKDDEFAAEVDKVKAGQIAIVMGQCYSGGFIDDLDRPSRVIATACKYDEFSYSTSDYLYDEFVYHWTAAVAGEYPDGTGLDWDPDTDGDGYISMKEAFDYGDDSDTQSETPQYKSNPHPDDPHPVHFGEEVTLFGATGPDLMMQDLEEPPPLAPPHFIPAPDLPGLILAPSCGRDTGLEPDPGMKPCIFVGGTPDQPTYVEKFWASPDIVVRHAPDGGTKHQDPEGGVVNYVYVRARNRGCEPVSGTIVVYGAYPSISLVWPESWTQIGTIAVSSLAPGDVLYDYFEWTPLYSQSYSLLARFVSAQDPMTYAEQSDVEYNVKHNNNIVWKNVSVVGDWPSFADAGIPYEEVGPFLVSFPVEARQSADGDTFLDHGDVFVELEQELFDRWSANGQQGQGFEIVGPNTLRMLSPNALIANTTVDVNEVFSITVRFELPEEQPCEHSDTYFVDLSQFVACDQNCTEECILIGDLDDNCVVDFNDVQIIAENWLLEDGPTGPDLVSDGIVDLKDFSVLAANWLGVAVDVTGGMTYEIRMDSLYRGTEP